MADTPVPAPRIALCDGTVNITWSDGSAFNGFILVNLIPPTDGVTQWSEVDYGNLYPGLRLPIYQRIPIIDGQLNTSCGLYYNVDLVPPGSVYQAYFYDSTGRKIAGPSANFTVSSSPFQPTVPSLTVPTGPGSGTTPDS